MQTTEPVRTIMLFVPADTCALEIAAVMDVFAEANAQASPRALYRLTLASEVGAPIKCASGLTIVPDLAIDQPMPGIDTLYVAGSYHGTVAVSERVTAWIADQARLARRCGAICNGAFLLGPARLIDGRHVTTHWRYADTLASQYPNARLDADRILVRDGDLFTTAGVAAAIDMALALVDEDHGRELARAIARYMLLYLKRSGGHPRYSVPLSVQTAMRSPIARVQAWITDHPADDLGIAALAREAAMSPRNFSRVFLKEAGVTPAEFVEGKRLDAARRLLEETELPLEQVARASGFGTAAAARRAFVRRIGVTLKQYRDRFKREVVHEV